MKMNSPCEKLLNINDQSKRDDNDYPDKALRMMQKMGYKSGSGLGRTEQGTTGTIDISFQFGRRGLGSKPPEMESWNFSEEEISVKENISWLENQENSTNFTVDQMLSWIKEGPPNYNIEKEMNFCDKNILQCVLKAKDIFKEHDLLDLYRARKRSNPFETIKSAFFMNRAALKIANIDAATNFMFSNINENEHHKNDLGPYYFADVCAGPGGFTEYMLWRKQWLFKGFGLTLKEENDFKVNESTCASPVTFQAFYGKDNDGNVCSPNNIWDFREKILRETDGVGVHFMMSDGGFSVEGKEDLQEILSKNIYISQCLVALEIIRPHGLFVTKLFDTFTLFSVGLLYLMYKCFGKVTIMKPNSSRPANAERYFVCSDLKSIMLVEHIRTYLQFIVRRLWTLKDNTEIDVLEIVPLDIIKNDLKFYLYIVESNNRLGERQIMGLKKLAVFCRNPTLTEIRQEDLRKNCLQFWKIPDKPKYILPELEVNTFLHHVLKNPEIILAQPREINSVDNFNISARNMKDWHYCAMWSSKKENNSCIYAGVGSSKVLRLQHNKWVKAKNIHLCRGTLLYGEFVREQNIRKKGSKEEPYKYSLHVIDALQLGEKCLADLPFNERMDLVKIYCKAVNKESQANLIRIRPKIFDNLESITTNTVIKREKEDYFYYSVLPILGHDSVAEEYDVNSVLLLKTNINQFFHSTYLLRLQIFIHDEGAESERKQLLLDDIVTEIKRRL